VVNTTQGPLIEHCKNVLRSFYGDDPQASDSFGRIVNSHHFKYVLVVNLCSHLYFHFSVELNQDTGTLKELA